VACPILGSHVHSQTFAAIDVRYGAPIQIGPKKEGLRAGIEAVMRSLHEVNGTS